MATHDDPAAIERELESTRQRIDSTLSELEERLSPGQLLDQAIRFLRGGGTGTARFAASVGQAAQANPLPVVLAGVGLTWLIVSDRERERSERWRGGELRADEPGRLNEKLEGAVETAREGVSAIGERMHQVGDMAQHAGERIGERVARGAAWSRSSLQQMLESQPLLLGLAGFAIGAVLGGSLPPTESEDKLIGERRDDLIQRGTDKAREGVESARRRFEEAGGEDASPDAGAARDRERRFESGDGPPPPW